MPKGGPWRKRRGIPYDAWHWCWNCSDWPTSDYDEQYTRPTAGEECMQCREKESYGNCS